MSVHINRYIQYEYMSTTLLMLLFYGFDHNNL